MQNGVQRRKGWGVRNCLYRERALLRAMQSSEGKHARNWPRKTKCVCGGGGGHAEVTISYKDSVVSGMVVAFPDYTYSMVLKFSVTLEST